MQHDAALGSGGAAPSGRASLVLWALALAAAAHALSLVASGVGPVDDDYIVYCYARTWLETGTFGFYPGAPAVEGFTSPFWMLLTSGGLLLGLTPEVWTLGWGVASTFALVLFAGYAARAARFGKGWLLAPALLALSPATAWHAVAGLGTVPLAASLAAALWAAFTDRRAAFVLASVIAVLFRLEALVAVVPLGLAGALGGKRGKVLRWVAPALAAVALVTVARWLIFGRLAPVTYFVKRLPLDVEVGYGARYLLRSAASGGWAVIALLAVCAAPERNRRLAWALAAACCGALLQVLVVGGDWMVYDRFLVPIGGLAAVGASAVLGGVRSGAARLAIGCAAVLAVAAGLRPDVRTQAIATHHFFERWWLTVGDALGARAPKGTTVATSPIGAIAWRSKLPVIDCLGLTHDAFLGLAPDLGSVGVKGHHRHDGTWVLDQEPSLLILGNGVIQPGTGSLDVNPWEADIVADRRFSSAYAPASLELKKEHGSAMTLPYFIRVGAAPIKAPR